MLTPEEQVQVADAARRHAQAISTTLVNRVRELEAAMLENQLRPGFLWLCLDCRQIFKHHAADVKKGE